MVSKGNKTAADAAPLANSIHIPMNSPNTIAMYFTPSF